MVSDQQARALILDCGEKLYDVIPLAIVLLSNRPVLQTRVLNKTDLIVQRSVIKWLDFTFRSVKWNLTTFVELHEGLVFAIPLSAYLPNVDWLLRVCALDFACKYHYATRLAVWVQDERNRVNVTALIGLKVWRSWVFIQFPEVRFWLGLSGFVRERVQLRKNLRVADSDDEDEGESLMPLLEGFARTARHDLMTAEFVATRRGYKHRELPTGDLGDVFGEGWFTSLRDD
jgi:hypothetical protein